MSEQQAAPSELDRQLISWAGDYAADPSNKLLPLSYDPSAYPGQDGHVIKGGGQGKHTAHVIAREAFKPHSFDDLLEQLDTPQQTERLQAAGELLQGNNNVVLGTNHGDLIDIAIAHAAVYERLRQLGYETGTGIIISKMVSFLAYDFFGDAVPCAEVLQNLEDEIYLSYPRTASADKRGLARLLPDEIERHNKHMRSDITSRLGKGALLLAVALSGTTDKEGDTPHDFTMAPVTNGTAKTLVAESTYILPTALFYKTGEAHMAVCDTPRFISKEAVLHNAMDSIASNLTQHVSGITYTYARPVEQND